MSITHVNIAESAAPAPPRLPSSEAARLARWLGAAQAGLTQVVLATGPQGAGKSMLAGAAAAAARERAFHIAYWRPGTALDVEIPAAEASPVPRTVSRPGDAAVLIELVRRGALNAHRWLVIVEDAHVVEPECLAEVSRFAHACPDDGTLVLLTASTDPPHSRLRTAQLVPELAGLRRADVYAIAPWSARDVEDLVFPTLKTVTPTIRFSHELAQVAGGNPALIRAYAALVEALPPAEQLAVVSGARRLAEVDPPPLVRDWVQARHAAVAGDSRRLLQALAIWGLPATSATLSYLAGLSLAVVERELDDLEEAGHVSVVSGGRSGQFELPLLPVRLVVAREAPSILRRAIHRRASALLATLADETGHRLIRAQHHVEAGPLDAVRARQVLDACTLLLRRGRHESARDLLLAVVAQSLTSALPTEILTRSVQLLAESYTRSGDAGMAERLINATRVRTESAPREYLEGLHTLARNWASSGRELQGLLSYRYLAAHPATPPEARTGAMAEMIRLTHWTGRPDRALELTREGHRSLAGDRRAEAAIWFQQSLIAQMRGRPADSLRAARRALQVAIAERDDGTASRSMVVIGEAWLDSESADRAVRWMRGGVRRAERAQTFEDVSWNRNRLIPGYIEAGDWANAELAAQRATSLAASLNHPQTLRRSEAVLALIQALRGTVSPGFLSTRLTRSDLGNPALFSVVATARYEQQRLAGLDDHARRTIELATELLEDGPGWERLLATEALPRLASERGARHDADGLRTVVQKLSTLVTESPAVLPLARLELLVAQARLALLEAQPEEAATLLELARSGYQGMRYRWRWARISGELADAYFQLGRKARGVETLRSGFVALEQLGARQEARRIQQQLHAVGGRTPRVSERRATLTYRQMQVAVLAARGLSDREIAREMGVSWRTVTTHVHSVLKRLNLRSRYELAGWLGRDGQAR